MKEPLISVVIAAFNGTAYLDTCLQSLGQQESQPAVEIIVVAVEDEQIAALIKRSYPHASLLQQQAPKTIGQLRALGLQNAQGQIVALTEDHCQVGPDWLRNLITSHAQFSGPVIGGPIENAATAHLVDRVAFEIEYGRFAPPQQAGPVSALAAANVSYKRTVLTQFQQVWEPEYWEGAFHDSLRAAGYQLWLDPTLRVGHGKHFRLRDYLAERYQYSRWYAGRRAEASPNTRRLFFLALAPLLLPVLLVRILKPRQGERGQSWLSLPLILLAAIVAVLGDFVGTIAGPGDSAYHIR